MQAKNELNSMDAECGDGDFGTIMFIAFSNARKALEGTQSDDIGVVLNAIGNSILASAGGASGPMFGTLFIEAGKAARGKSEVELPELAMMLDKSRQEIQARGGARVGDKTIVDALEPAVNSLMESVTAETPLPLAVQKAADAAKAGCESTRRLTAKHGKAKYLGEQTLGFVDPGAYAITLIFDSLAGLMDNKYKLHA
jgi:dihydroxyacetone kinase-like protein